MPTGIFKGRAWMPSVQHIRDYSSNSALYKTCLACRCKSQGQAGTRTRKRYCYRHANNEGKLNVVVSRCLAETFHRACCAIRMLSSPQACFSIPLVELQTQNMLKNCGGPEKSIPCYKLQPFRLHVSFKLARHSAAPELQLQARHRIPTGCV